MPWVNAWAVAQQNNDSYSAPIACCNTTQMVFFVVMAIMAILSIALFIAYLFISADYRKER